MRPSQHPQLGRIVGEITRTIIANDNDPMNDYAGFTPSCDWAVDKIVRREGFANVKHFAAAVQKRTSARWAHMHLAY